MEFLAELDDELDFDEELISSQEITSKREPMRSQDNSQTHHSSLSTDRLPSPREEGEERSEDEEEYLHTFNKRGTEKVRADREEGEASSEDERRHSRISKNDRTRVSKRQTNIAPNVLLDEAQYRHRIHERYEQRELAHSKSRKGIQTGLLQDVRLPSKQANFVRPHSQSDINAGGLLEPDSSLSTYEEYSSREPERKWQLGGRDMTDEVTADRQSIDSANSRSADRYRKHRTEGKHIPEKPAQVDSFLRNAPKYGLPQAIDSDNATVSRSYSTSALTSEEMLFHSEMKQYRSGTGSKKTKSKKSKHSRPDKDGDSTEKDSRKESKASLPQASLDGNYDDWDPRHVQQYAIPSSEPGMKVKNIQPRISPTNTQSSPSSSQSSDSSKKLYSESRTQKLSSQQTEETFKKHRHKRHFEREFRETAPPPESLSSMSSGTVTGDSRKRGHKSDKYQISEIDQSSIYPSKHGKRSRTMKESHKLLLDSVKHQIRSRRAITKSQETTTSQVMLMNQLDEELKHTAMSLSPLRESQRSDNDASRSRPSAVDLSNSPFKEFSDASTGHSSDEIDNPPEKDVSNTKTDPVSQPAPIVSRVPHYNLYSETDDDDDAEQGDEINSSAEMEQMAIDEMEIPQKPLPPSKPFYFPSIQGCRSVEEFECLNRIEEGTYGVVYRARDKKINEIVALKRLKMEKERDGFPITSLREINTLMKAQHENIVTVREVVVGSNMDKIYLVMDYVEHDLKSLMEIMNGPFSVGEVKCLLLQLLRAVRHLHDNWILHRDLKTSNLLLSHQGILKVGDFGLAREYGSPLKHYTEIVVTLWYRAPELLLGIKQYTCPIDMWSVGCIFAEFLLQRPLFPGKGEVDELNIIFRDLGTPTERIWPGVSHLPGMKKCVFTDYPYNQLRRRFTEKQISDQGFDLLNSFLTYCPERRITAEKALSHAYFNERPRAIHPSMFPSWPAKSEGGMAVKKTSPRPQVGGGALAATAAVLAASGGARARYQPPAPPMGGQRFYSSMADSRPGTAIGSGDLISGSSDKGFLLRF